MGVGKSREVQVNSGSPNTLREQKKANFMDGERSSTCNHVDFMQTDDDECRTLSSSSRDATMAACAIVFPLLFGIASGSQLQILGVNFSIAGFYWHQPKRQQTLVFLGKLAQSSRRC